MSDPVAKPPMTTGVKLAIVGAFVGGLTIGALGMFISLGSPGSASTPPAADNRFADATAECKVSSLVDIGDSGRSMDLDMAGEENKDGVSFEKWECVLNALDIPDSTLEQMLATRALDGRQEGEWADIHASWSYHPDDGLDVILELIDG